MEHDPGSDPQPPSTADRYRRRVAAAEARLDELRRTGWVLSAVRAAVALLVLVAAWAAFDRGLLGPAWILLPVVAFAVLVVIHARLAREEESCRRSAELFRLGLRRVDGGWEGGGRPGPVGEHGNHPYARDLDLFGHGSLFELLCMARTRWGETTLAGWLLAPAEPEEIRRRQRAVQELVARPGLREALAVVGDEVGRRLEHDGLSGWLERARPSIPTAAVLAATVLPVVETVAIVGWLTFDRGGAAVLLLLVLHVVVTFRLRPLERRLLEGVSRSASELSLLARLLAVVEAEEVASGSVPGLEAPLAEAGAPSRAVTRLTRRVQLYESQRNMMFSVVAGFLFLGFHAAVACERWRRRHGADVPGWLAALGRLEALASLAWFADENPGDPRPELVEDGPVVVAEGLTHPLLPRAVAVRNELRLDAGQQVLVVSGSNMSGKSTLLRSLGVNLVLAQAGATVRARRLVLSPLAVGASIATVDSLREGRSRFFTEITRLKQIVDLCDGEAPVLFLIDEVLHGTNSHERRIGAELLVRGLIERGALGLLTTHDLALATLGDRLGPVVNVHFQDEVDGSRLRFDYRLRPGTVTRSNALALMRLVGLPVGEGGDAGGG